MKTQKLVSILKSIADRGRSAGAAAGKKSLNWMTNRHGRVSYPTAAYGPFSVKHPYITAAGRTGGTAAVLGGVGGLGYGMAQDALAGTGSWYNRLGKNLDTNSILHSGAGATLGGLGTYALTEDPLLTGIGAGAGAAAGYAFANPQLIKDAVKSLKKLIK